MKIAILFPGYGSQFVGMGKELYDQSRIMQEYFEEASNCLDMNFVKLCFASSDTELSKMSNAYSSIFLISSAIFQILKEEGVETDIVAGYSVGEFSAIHASGGISFADGLYFINKYVSFYENFISTIDASVIFVTGIKAETLKDICEQYSTDDLVANVAIYLSEDQHVVSGHTPVVDQVMKAAKEHGAKVDALGLEMGLHSDLMKPVFDSVKMYLEKVDFQDAEIPVLSITQVQPVKSAQALRSSFLDYISSPLLGHKVIDYLDDYDMVIEVGPGSSLTTILKNNYPDKLIIPINSWADIDTVKEIIEEHEDNNEKEEDESVEK